MDRAIDCYKQALLISREICYRRGEEHDLGNLGVASADTGQLKRAIKYYEQALKISREIGDLRGEANWLGNLGTAYAYLGRSDTAFELYRGAVHLTRKANDKRSESFWISRLGIIYYAYGDVEQAIISYKKALTIATQIGDEQHRSRCLMRLGEALLAAGKLSRACQCCQKSLDQSFPRNDYRATLILGIVLLQQEASMSVETLASAGVRCQAVLSKTKNLYRPRYSLATALVGQAVCDPRWEDESQRSEILAPALEEYRRALGITAAPGVVQDAIRDLELIQAAGIEGLEPAFELLENAEYEPDVPEDLPDILEHIKSA
jgi:tetratricopeptide (TPR) repeat protein